MGRALSRIVCLSIAGAMVLGACGGGEKKPVKKPIVKVEKPEPPKPETEADRAARRHAAALEIVPEGTSCFPQLLKEKGAPRLELAAIDKQAVICAIDRDKSRLLGAVACWRVELGSAGLVYEDDPKPIPGRNVSVLLDGRCARGYCIPKDAKLPEDNIVHMAISPDGAKVVVIAGDDAHIFDAAAKAREGGFSIRGDNGVTNTPTGVNWVGNSIFIMGADDKDAESYVFQFRTDGQAVGPLMALGGKKERKLSTHDGSFLILDESRVAVAEKGFSSVTAIDVASGKRARSVRRTPNGPCRKKEVASYWSGDGEIRARCKKHLDSMFTGLIGADAVAGKTNLLALLRGPRLGELAVLDVRNLKEKKSIKLPWCKASDGDADGDADGDVDGESSKKPADKKADKRKAAKHEAAKHEAAKRKAAKRKARRDDDDDDEEEDPDAGGE